MNQLIAPRAPLPADTQVKHPVAPAEAVVDRADALRAMYDHHALALLAFAERFTTHESAQDAVQETFLRAWRNLPRLWTDPRTLRPWLRQVLRRVLIDAHRADRVRPLGRADDVFDRAVEGGYERVLDRWRLEQALEVLSPSHRHVLVEIYYRDTPSAQLADTLGVPAGTVRSRLHYALGALRRQLTETAEETRARSLDPLSLPTEP